jgi:hypothetical protein
MKGRLLLTSAMTASGSLLGFQFPHHDTRWATHRVAAQAVAHLAVDLFLATICASTLTPFSSMSRAMWV